MASRISAFVSSFRSRFRRATSTTAGQTTLQYASYMLWFPALICFNNHVGELTPIQGQSMYPFLNKDGNMTLKRDVVWVDKWNPLQGLRRGMVVTLWSPLRPEALTIKRVIALEGDTVFPSRTFPNGKQPTYPLPYAVVPQGQVWVEGDAVHNGKESVDSNTYGPVSMSLITGRVTHVVWPLERVGRVSWWEGWEGKGGTRVVRGRKRSLPVWT